MIVTKPDGSTEDIPLFDFGTGSGDGVPVVWNPGVGVCQDPNYGSNCYSPGAVLTDDNGHWYQIGSDWAIRPMGSAGPAPSTNPSTQKPPTTSSVTGVATPINSANKPANPADPNVRAAQRSASTLGTFFSQQLQLGQGFALPYWLLAAGGAALIVARRRRR